VVRTIHTMRTRPMRRTVRGKLTEGSRKIGMVLTMKMLRYMLPRQCLEVGL